ncbi:MAG: helix-turn-helix transcriptional regulator [Clostridiales bacterium]|nr:helix-turn-helix transcriptional regulator [Clostridiales bacterium]
MVSYKPLFRYCLEHDISKADCRRICGISPNTWTKINRNEEVSMAILNKICAGLGISYGDIMEYIPVTETKECEVEA